MASPGSEPIVVIGGGIGGLSAALRLAAAGHPVVLLEQQDRVGGKMGQVASHGFRWDTGPSVITMRSVFSDLFQAAGRSLEEYLSLVPVEPLTRYFYPDSTVLDATRDLTRMADQIGRFREKDVAGYLRYLAYAAQLHRITGPVFIYDTPPTPASFLRVPPWDAVKVDPLRTMDQSIRSFVGSPYLRQLLGRFATYVGGSPYQAPATLNVIAHVEMTGGVWYPSGGIYAIACAMERLAQDTGVEIRTGTPVDRIDTEGGRARGVILRDGTRIPARAVVANVDVTTVYSRLLPPGTIPPSAINRLLNTEPSCSGFIMLLGVEGTHPQLAHHNIFFSPDYPREFRQIFREGLPPEDPTVYVAITAKSDPDHAPQGCENWFVLVNVPAHDQRFDWSTQAQAYGQKVLEALGRFGLDLTGRIRCRHLLTPLDLERLTGAHRGALYGASPNSRWTAFRRPHNRSRELPGLYFAGGTAHPGGGVPMVTLSGKVAADFVLADLARGEL